MSNPLFFSLHSSSRCLAPTFQCRVHCSDSDDDIRQKSFRALLPPKSAPQPLPTNHFNTKVMSPGISIVSTNRKFCFCNESTGPGSLRQLKKKNPAYGAHLVCETKTKPVYAQDYRCNFCGRQFGPYFYYEKRKRILDRESVGSVDQVLVKKRLFYCNSYLRRLNLRIFRCTTSFLAEAEFQRLAEVIEGEEPRGIRAKELQSAFFQSRMLLYLNQTELPLPARISLDNTGVKNALDILLPEREIIFSDKWTIPSTTYTIDGHCKVKRARCWVEGCSNNPDRTRGFCSDHISLMPAPPTTTITGEFKIMKKLRKRGYVVKLGDSQYPQVVAENLLSEADRERFARGRNKPKKYTPALLEADGDGGVGEEGECRTCKDIQRGMTRRTAGLNVMVCSDSEVRGLIQIVREMLRSESPTHRYEVLLEYMKNRRRLFPEFSNTPVLIYHDDACTLGRFIWSENRINEIKKIPDSALVKSKLSDLIIMRRLCFCVDSFHAPNHKGVLCAKFFRSHTPAVRSIVETLPQPPNSEAAEQLFSWLRKYSGSFSRMNSVYFRTMVLEVCDSHNTCLCLFGSASYLPPPKDDENQSVGDSDDSEIAVSEGDITDGSV